MIGVIYLDNATNHNMHPAAVKVSHDTLYIHMDDHDAYHGWKFTEKAENQLFEILFQRMNARKV